MPPIWVVLAPRLPAFSAVLYGSFRAGHASIRVAAVASWDNSSAVTVWEP